MKDLVIGGFTNYDYKIIRPWVESFEEVNDSADKVLIVGNTTQETVDILKSKNWTLVPMSKGQAHVVRFFDIFNFLKDNWHNYRYVVTTDVRDVIFQADPFTYIDNALTQNNKHMICGSECLKYQDEPWGNQNLYETYGKYIWEIYKDRTIYNVGVLGGKSAYIRDLTLNIAINSINRPIPIVDQAVFNMLINTHPYEDAILKADMENGWVCNAGTVANPSMIDQFRPHLLEAEPQLKKDKIYTSTGKTFTIVHQYDRVPEWKQIIESRYE